MVTTITEPTPGASGGVWGTQNNAALTALLAGLNALETGGVSSPQGLPSYAPTDLNPAHRFNSETGFYNLTPVNMRRAKIALGRAAAGGSAHFLTNSDSDGAGTNQGVQAPLVFDRRAAWPISMGRTLASLGVPVGGTGIIRYVDNTVSDDRVTFTGTWISALAYLYSSVSGSSITVTLTAADFPSQAAYTGVRWWYYDSNGTDFTLSINGATSGADFVTVVPGNTLTYKHITLLGRNIGPGTTLKMTKTTATLSVASGIDIFTPNSGLSCHNPSQGGSKAASSGATSWSDSAQLGQVYRDCAGTTGRVVTDASFTVGANTITSAAAGFSDQDIGKPLVRNTLVATVPFLDNTYIQSIDSPSVARMSTNAVRTLTAQTVTIDRQPDLLIISLGANDKPIATTPIATITAAITTIRNFHADSDVLLCIEQQQADALIPAANWEAFAAAMYHLADTLDCALYDYRFTIGNFTQGSAAGYYGDSQAHLKAGAARARGRAMALAVAV